VSKTFLVIFFLACVACLFGVGWRDLWTHDETRYTRVGVEMHQTGNWSVPQLNGKDYLNKPPLCFWVSGLLYKIMPKDDYTLAGLLPSALAGIALVVVVFFIARNLFDETVAVVSCLMLMSNYLFFYLSRMGQLDLPMVFFATLGVYFATRYFFSTKKNIKWLYFMFIPLGLSALAKGVGVITSLLAILPLVIYDIRNEGGKIRSYVKVFFGGVGIVVLMLMTWGLMVCFEIGFGAAFSRLMDETVLRFAGKSQNAAEHIEPFYYFFKHLPLNFLPWTVFLPPAIVMAWQKRKDQKFAKTSTFLLGWAGLVFLMFQVNASKRYLYLMPMYPAIAMISGWYLVDAVKNNRHQKFITYSLHLMLGLILLATTLIAAMVVLGPENIGKMFSISEKSAAKLSDLQVIFEHITNVSIICYGLIIFTVLRGFFELKKGKKLEGFTATSVAMLIITTFTASYIFREVNPFVSYRTVGQGVNALVPEKANVSFWASDNHSRFNLYMDRNFGLVADTTAAKKFLGNINPARIVARLKKREVENLYHQFDQAEVPYKIIYQRQIGKKVVVLLSNGR